MTTVKHYITKEIELITQFCHLLEKDECKSKLSTKINKAVEHYLKVINAIDYFKFSYVVHGNTKEIKEQIFKHNDEIFVQPRLLIPTIDFSDVYLVVKDTDDVNIFWDILAQLTVLSSIISDEIIKNKQKKKDEDITQKMKNLSIKGGDISLSSMMNQVSNEYENSSLLDFVKDIDVENANITDVLMNIVKKVDIGAELEKLDESQLAEINNVVKEFFGDDKTDFSFLVKDISETLKHTDITEGNVSDNLQNIAQSITDKMINSNNEETLKNIASNAQGLMKNYDPHKDMMSNVETIMKSKFGKDFKGIDKKALEQAIQSMGLSGAMGMNSRKLKRMAARESNRTTNSHKSTGARVNNKQAALKAKYEERKKINEKKKETKEKEIKEKESK